MPTPPARRGCAARPPRGRPRPAGGLGAEHLARDLDTALVGGQTGPIGKRLCATFDSRAALFAWLQVEAKKRGYGTKRTLFLADGAEAI